MDDLTEDERDEIFGYSDEPDLFETWEKETIRVGQLYPDREAGAATVWSIREPDRSSYD